MARHPNLIVVRASDASIHERWLTGVERNFDLMVSYSGDQPGRFGQGVEYYVQMKGPEWPGHHAILSHYMKLIGNYERIAIVRDDIDADAAVWKALLYCAEWFGIDILHPSVSGTAATDLTRPHPGCILRYVNVVDSLAPIFSRRALERVMGTFSSGLPEGELPLAWSRYLTWPEYRCAIVDTASVTRTRHAWSTPARAAIEIREHARLRIAHEET